ncbi:MAG: phosphoribosyltransferase [Bacteroidia bacterium]|nr:phosphoribosyltransferase [Bacteroidia bacterium]
METADIILNHRQIKSKIVRLAWQIYENNMDESVLWIAGIDERGMHIAEMIQYELSLISNQELRLLNIVIDRKNFEPAFYSDFEIEVMKDAVVIVVDDVLNSGKTMFSAMLPLIRRQVVKIQVAVLASRSHRLFPVKADFVGISMATTLQEHLNFDNSNPDNLNLTLS